MMLNGKTIPDGCVRGQTAIAEAIQNHFQIPCGRTVLHDWQRKRNPPFPTPTDNDRTYRLAECFEWIEKYICPKRDEETESARLGKMALEADYRRKIALSQKAEMDLQIQKGEYIDANEAFRESASAFRAHHAFVRREIEKHGPDDRKMKLVELGAGNELIAQFYEWDLKKSQATVDQIEEACEKEAQDAD